MLVILDNGHGIDTPGKRSPIWSDGTQLFEWQFNRDMVYRIASKLNFKGIRTHILVPEDKDISLSERAVRANEIKEKSILVSVHANAGKKPEQGFGFEAHVIKGKTKALDLAEHIYNFISWVLPNYKLRKGDVSSGYQAKRTNLYILRKVWMPATLLEIGFMDTFKNCQLLMSELWKDVMSSAIANGIENYIEEENNKK